MNRPIRIAFQPLTLAAVGLLALICALVISPPPPTVSAQSAPSAPTGLSAASGDQSVTLTWDDPSDSTITRYEYQVNHNATGTGNLSGWSRPWKDIPGSDSATTSHAFTGLTNGSEYRYKIRAVTEIGEGNDAPSPAAPTGSPWYVSATPQGAEPLPVSKFWAERVCDDSFKVRWKRVPGATGYDLNLSRDHRKSWRRLMTNKNYNAWQFSQWDKDRTYWFAIRAVNAHGASAWTDLQSIALPCPVEGLKATYAANGDISVSWKPAKRASSYDVNFSADAGRSWQRMGSNLSATAYSFNKAPDALPYNPNFLVAVQSRKGGMTGGWRNAPVAQVVEVSNLDQAVSQYDCSANSNSWCVAGFTTGTSNAGYTLASVTAKFNDKLDPAGDNIEVGDIVVSLHAADNSGDADSATLATLSGSNPDTAGEYTYTCSGSGCALAASTTYFIQFKSTDSTGINNAYRLLATDSDDETQTPSGNGWSLANGTDNWKVDGNQWIRYPEASLIQVSATSNP